MPASNNLYLSVKLSKPISGTISAKGGEKWKTGAVYPRQLGQQPARRPSSAGLGKSESNTAVPGRGTWIMIKKKKKTLNGDSHEEDQKRKISTDDLPKRCLEAERID